MAIHNDPIQHDRDQRRTNQTEEDENRRVEATSSGMDKGVLTGIFDDRDSAERAYNEAIERGYKPSEINVVMSEETRKNEFSDAPTNVDESSTDTKALEGTGAGSAIGGGLGAAAGIIAAVGTSIAIPGLGIVLSGPVAAGLAGAGAGGITGGIIGALVGAGIPEEQAETYEEGIQKGKILISVDTHSEADARYLENQWQALHGEEIHY